MSILLKILGDYCIGEPPLTIPNREVKPICADGTAYCGRVGRRLSYLNPVYLLVGGIFYYTPFQAERIFLSKVILSDIGIYHVNTCFTLNSLFNFMCKFPALFHPSCYLSGTYLKSG